MKKDDAIRHFGGNSALAEALGISPSSVSEWGELVPELRAYQLQVMTAGLLRVDPALYRKDEKPEAA